jgi:HEAT repeat protein
MNRTLILIAMLTSLHLFASQASAAGFDPPSNGWASWEIPAISGAPAWCCHEWEGSPTSKPSCKLDEEDHGYGSRGNATTTTVRIYARFAAGKLERLRPLSADCPVQSNSQIRQLSPSEPASVEWLAGLLKGDADEPRRSRGDIMSALVLHRTPLAYDALARIARQDARLEHRKDAVFWLAHLRGREGASLTTSLMFEDADARLREHASFALTQSVSPRIAEDLMRLATTDREGQVRGQAWFWLAHTAAPQTEPAIEAALRKETDRHVREQAVFALSRLPEERATRALISVAENQALTKEDRKKAIFWLSQASSDRAIAYIDKIVTGKR